jgi:DNA-binding HxlR family transcriptional regulator
MVDWQKSLFELSDAKILLYLYEKKSAARYSELHSRVLSNRNTIANSLRQLQENGLIERRVKATRPIQTEFTLSEKGKKLALHLAEMRKLLEM